jgi:3-oxoacyl-(acyl-carrier-protein) synthase
VIEARDGRRVVITGVGVLAPCGIGAEAFWAGLSKPAEPETNRRIGDFDPAEWGLKHVDVRRIERFAQLAIAAAGSPGETPGSTRTRPTTRIAAA